MILLCDVNMLLLLKFEAFSANNWLSSESLVYFIKLWYIVLYHELERSMVIYDNQLDDLKQKECSDFESSIGIFLPEKKCYSSKTGDSNISSNLRGIFFR